MADPPPEKKVRGEKSDEDNIDRLSALPDCVLLHILSSFKTKDAAATSILSRRWRNLFISLPDIHLSISVDNDASDRDRLFSDFIDFSNRVFRQRNNAPIKKIRFFVKHFVERYRLAFESWLLSAAAAISLSSIQELGISVLINETTMPFLISIPPGFLSCKTLVSLSLNLWADWIVPDLVSLPNLKFLNLSGFKLVDEDCFVRFLRGCPSLEELMLHLRPFYDERESGEGIEVEVLDISNPSLKKLILCWHEKVELEFTIIVKSKNFEYLLCFLEGQHKVNIDAPKITSLDIVGRVLEVNIIQDLMSLDTAGVQSDFLYYITTESDLFLRGWHAFKFMSGLQNLKSLSLSEKILKALYFSQRGLPTFRNLIKLELIPFYCHDFPRMCIWKVLSSLFESSPNLEVLIFQEVFKNYFSEDEELDSVFPEALPLTFIEHLKEIEFKNFEGEEHEFKLVEYFLKNAKTLKKMTIAKEPWNSVPECRDRILSFKKCSEDCQIVFKKKMDWIKCPQLRKALNLSV
ncbi:unnamed protein product [Coffea canephora]|uniref:F-box domain-containing protein n=1 Tax=Coffea canephora TaxID=49390 RepID=A0A068UZQ5_COFCA|nr:unnamed protein product [Coffea canephora]